MVKKIQETDVPKTNSRWPVVIGVLIVLMLISFFSAIIMGFFITGNEVEPEGNVAKINIIGPILPYSTGGFMSDDVTSSTEVVKLIEKANKNDNIKAILFEVNSGGGTPVASYEIAEAIRQSREKYNKTTVAWIREVGASGAYWIASETDYIVANPMTVTGSIGVIASYIDWSGTLEKYNASYQRLVAGKYKDMGSPLRSLNNDEEKIIQENLNLVRQEFVNAVAKNRNINQEDIEIIADGRYYLGVQAYDLGLVDKLGGKQEVKNYLKDKLGQEVEIAEYTKPVSFIDSILGAKSDNIGFNIGRGLGYSMNNKMIENNHMSTSIRT